MTEYKVGDHLRVTYNNVYEGAVTEVSLGGSIVRVGGLWHHIDGAIEGVTIERIEKPREIGWWEVNYDSGGGTCATLWDGTCWNWSHGEPVLYQESVHPLHYIGKGSGDE